MKKEKRNRTFVREDAKKIIFERREEKRRETDEPGLNLLVILTFALPAESPPFAASLLPALDAALLCFVRVFRWNRFVPLSFTPYVDVMTLFHAVRSLDNDATADRVGMVCCLLWFALLLVILHHFCEEEEEVICWHKI